MFQRYDAQTTSTSQRFKRKLESFTPGSWSPSRYIHIYIYLIYTQPNIYPKISRYIYIEQIYTQARRLDSYNFLFFLGIIMIFFLVSWITDENSNSFAPFQAAISWLGASGSAVRKWSWLGWIWLNRKSRFETSSSQTWALGDPHVFFAFKCVSSFCPHFLIWFWSLKGRFIRIRAIKSNALESPLQRVRSVSFRNPADYKKNLPKNRWLIGADGQKSAEDFRSTVYIGVNLLFFFIPRCRISCINSTVRFYHQH